MARIPVQHRGRQDTHQGPAKRTQRRQGGTGDRGVSRAVLRSLNQGEIRYGLLPPTRLLVCCIDRLNPPSEAAFRKPGPVRL
jgi:hypothetical protein